MTHDALDKLDALAKIERSPEGCLVEHEKAQAELVDAVPALVVIARAALRVVSADNDRDQAAAIVALRAALEGA